MAIERDFDPAAQAAELERWARDWYDRAINKQDLTVIDEKASDTFSCTNTTIWEVEGLKGQYESYSRTHKAFPDAQVTIHDIVAQPGPHGVDKVSVWFTVRGTHTGPLQLDGDQGVVEPTGRKVEIGCASLLYVQDGKMVAARAISDMMLVLGVSPSPPGPEADR